MGRLAIVFLTGVWALPGQVAVSEAAGKVLHVAVEIPTKNHQLWPGALTFAANEVKFETDQRGSDELLFSIPIKDVEEVEVAGFRERFLSLKIRPNSDFVKAYSFLLSDNRSPGPNPLTVSFALGAKEDLRAGMATVNDFKSHLAHVPVIATSRMAGQIPETAERSATTPGLGADRRATDLFRQEARYLEKLKGFSALMVNNLSGTAGELVFFDDGFGYRSERQNPRISATKSQFLEAGYLKFRLKNDWVQNVVYKPVKGNSNCMIMVVQIRKDSVFFSNSRSLMTDTGNDNEIAFVVATPGQYQIAKYFRTKLKGNF